MTSTSDPDQMESNVEPQSSSINLEYIICDIEDVACYTEIDDIPDVPIFDTEDMNCSSDVLKTEDQETQTLETDFFNESLICYMKLKSEEVEYFTGLSADCFELIFSYTKECRYKSIDCRLLDRDQLLVTLMKYKNNYKYSLLSILFRTDKKIISEIIQTWTNALFITFKRMDCWEIKCTRDSLYTVMLDCFEIPIEKPEDPDWELMTRAYEINTYALKSLIGMDEAGCIIFISDLYTGKISERELVEKSGFLQKLNSGDCVLADVNFMITDLLKEKNVLLNWPPIYRHKQKLTRAERIQTKKTTKRSRCNVKKVLESAGDFKILIDIWKSDMWPMLNKIHFICFNLINIRTSIIDIHSII